MDLNKVQMMKKCQNLTKAVLAKIKSPANIRMSFLVGQNERTDELNTRIGERHANYWSSQPRFNPIPETTKYTHFPILDKTPTTMFVKMETNIDLENELFCKNDRLVKYDTKQKLQFQPPTSSPFQPIQQHQRFSETIGNDLFHNHTRTQLRQPKP